MFRPSRLTITPALFLLAALFFVACGGAANDSPPTNTAEMPTAQPTDTLSPPTATTEPTIAPTAAPPTAPPATTAPTTEPSTAATPTAVLPNAIRGDDGALMHLVPAGELWMGSNLQFIGYAVRQCRDSGADDTCEESEFISEAPDHGVILDAFYMDETEVTNGQYRTCVDAGACTPPADPRFYDDPAYDRHPVVFVTWHDARTYCDHYDKRLPTEAEWERAARGVGYQQFPWGDEWEPARANTQEQGSGSLQPVGQYPDGASPFGILDLSGNAWEWVNDWYDAAYYEYSPQDNPLGPPSGSEKVLRGGGFSSHLHYARAANRGAADPNTNSIFRGFRCVQSPPDLS